MGRPVLAWAIAIAAAAAGGAARPSDALAAPPASPEPAPRSATRPASRPTTATTQPADLSTPKAALRALAGALKSGSEQDLAHVVASGNDAERRVVAVMAEFSSALGLLRHAAVSAYGEQSAAKLTTDPDAGFRQSMARIDAAEVVVAPDGDSATVRYPGAEQPEYTLVRSRTDGQWRIPASHFSKHADPAALDRRVAELQLQVRIVRELSREIAAGKYRNAETATEAWQSKVMQALGPKPSGAATKGS
jgi:hypothetical protein